MENQEIVTTLSPIQKQAILDARVWIIARELSRETNLTNWFGGDADATLTAKPQWKAAQSAADISAVRHGYSGPEKTEYVNKFVKAFRHYRDHAYYFEILVESGKPAEMKGTGIC